MFVVVFLMIRRPPRSTRTDTLFPYTTLFRSYSDYLTLYEQVRAHRPREILECGTGISTVVLAQALRENAAESGQTPGRVTSMEDDPDWHRLATERLPEELRAIVEIVHSPKVDGFYKCFRGVCYERVPDRPYDFVFSDGPDRHSPVNGDKLFNLDLINVVRRSETPVRAVVANPYLTFYELQKVFGLDKARRSEEHTSELQSLMRISYAVFCFTKKKKN